MRLLSVVFVTVLTLLSLTAISEHAFAAAPVITSINPTSVSTTASTNSLSSQYTNQSGVISGSGLANVTSIQVGNWTIQGSDISTFVYLNTSGTIGFYIPTAASAGYSSGGSASVTVTTAQGTSLATMLTYVSPSFSLPSAGGPISGNVQFSGTGLSTSDSYTVCFGQNTCISNVTPTNTSGFSVTLPSGGNAPVAGTTVTVTVTDASTQTTLTASGNASYTFYSKPAVTGLSQNSGNANVSNQITVSGSGFVAGQTTVAFVANAGSSAGTSVSVASNGQSLTVNTPTGVTPGTPTDVVVTTPGGSSTKTAADTYTFTQASAVPSVTSVTPNTGSTLGGTSVTITGSGFTGATGVTFDGTAATNVAVVNDSQITVTTPVHIAGSVNVVVTTPAGSGTGTNVFTYAAVGSPTLTGYGNDGNADNHGTGFAAGGYTVDLAGTGFTSGSTYTVNVGNTTVQATATSSGQLNVSSWPSQTQAGSATPTVSVVGASGSLTYTYIAGQNLQISVSVGSPAIALGQSDIVTITVQNPNNIDAYGFGLKVPISDSNIPPNFNFTASPSGCPFATSAGPNLLLNASNKLGANTTCTYTATITPTAVETISFPATVTYTSTATPSTTVSLSGAPATINVVSALPPSVAASYAQSQISIDGSTTLTLTLTNGNGTALTSAGASFSVAPMTLTGVTGGTCGTSSGSGSTLTLSAATIPASGSCTVTATVVAPNGLLGAMPLPTVSSFTSTQTGTVSSGLPTVSGTQLVVNLTLPAVTGTYKTGQLTNYPFGSTVLPGTVYALGTASSGPFSSAITLQDGSTAIISGTSVNFTASATAQGTETLYYVLQNSSQATTTAAAITLTPATKPTLTAITATAAQGTSATSINVATLGNATGSPTGYSVAKTATGTFAGSAQTTAGGTVSITSAGAASYTPPNASYTGTDTFYVEASNAGGNSNPVAVTVQVVGLTVSLTGSGATENVPLAGYKVAVSGGTAPYTCQLANGSQMPAGLTVNSDCTITGTPTVSGANLTFSVQVSDGSTPSITTTKQLSLTIVVPAVAPRLSAFTTHVAENSSGNAINVAQLASAQGTTTAYAVSATSSGSFGASATTAHGSVSITSAGAASYTPTTGFNGTDTFYVTASNGSLTSTPVAATVTVTAATLTIKLQGAGAIINYPLTNFSIAVSGGVAPYSCHLASGQLPAGATLSPSCALTGTPTVAGVFSFAVSVTDSSSPVVTQTSSALSLLVNTSRPDPSKDAEVVGLVTAQTQVAEQFADTQIHNFNSRLEQMHGDGHVSDSFGVSLTNGLDQDTDQSQNFADLDPLSKRGQAADNATARAMKKSDEDSTARAKLADDKMKAAALDRAFSFWTAGAIQVGRLHNNNTVSTTDLTTAGLSAGVDYRFSQFLSIGFGLGYGVNASEIGTNGTATTGRNYDAVLYGSIRPTTTSFIDLVAGAGLLDFTSDRYITGVGGLARGKRSGYEFFGSITSGADFHVKSFTLTPYVRVDGKTGSLNAFDENAPGIWALHYDKETFSTASVDLGLKAAMKLKNDMAFMHPFFRAEFQHDLVNNANAGVTYVDLVGSGLDYSIALPGSDTNRVMLGIGADMNLNDFKLTLEYLNTFSTGSTSDASTVTFHVTKAF